MRKMSASLNDAFFAILITSIAVGTAFDILSVISGQRSSDFLQVSWPSD